MLALNGAVGGCLSPADPAGVKPRRDHRFLDRVSRHEVPKTPGKKTPREIYDPVRVSFPQAITITSDPWRARWGRGDAFEP